MELSKSAKEILTQAQMFRIDNNADELCVEHLLYGILVLAKENSADGRQVKEIVSKEMMNPEAAMIQLKKDSKIDSGSFKAAGPVLGRATELAHGSEIGCKELTKAVFESNTPTILALKGLVGFRGEPAQKPNPAPAVKPAEKPAEKKELNTHEKALLLAVLAAALNSQKDELVNNTGSRRNRVRKPNVRRRTKMGPFTYRGGTVAAAFQYFLFGILVPLALAFLLQKFTGFFSKPHGPFVNFIAGTLGALWVFYLARGVALLLGLISSAFGNFLDIILDIGLIAAIVRIIQISWHMPVIPTWLRAIACICVFLVIFFGAALFEYLRDEGKVQNAKITFMNLRGTPSKIFFQYTVKCMMVPFLIFAVIWIFRLTPPNWLMKTFAILGFGYVWNLLNTACTCCVMSAESRRSGARKFLRFIQGFVSYLVIPALVYFLHRLFHWWPMKTWVLIVLGVYLVLTLILAIAYANQNA